MSLSPRRAAALLGAAALLVVGTDSATYAGTGDSLILGQMNNAPRSTTLTTRGDTPPLRLDSPDGVPSLRVSSDVKVKRLNADQLDGKTSRELEPKLRVFTADESADDTNTEQAWEIPVKGQLFRASFNVIAVGDGAADAQCILAPEPYVSGSSFVIPNSTTAALISGAGIVSSQDGRLFVFCTSDQTWDPAEMVVTLTPVEVGKVSEIEHAPPVARQLTPGKLTEKFWRNLAH